MKQFVFETKQKNVLLGGMALGGLCLAASYFSDITGSSHTRFWTNLLQNSVFFTGISFTMAFVLSATTTAWAGWHVAFKRIWEAMSYFMPVGLIGLTIVGIGAMLHWHHLYVWADAIDPKDKVLSDKKQFLNVGWYFLSLGFVVVWFLFARLFRKYSIEQDKSMAEYKWYNKLQIWSATFMPIAGFSSAAAIWLWIMSLDAHWFSTMFAWYTTASWFVSAIALTLLIIIYLKSNGHMHWITQEHLHDLGKFLFAFSIFWTYLWFSQYMLIWYANIGEETIYFRQRMGEFPGLFYGNLVVNFLLPFLILMRNDTKRKFGTLAFSAILVFFGHWMDFFQMVKIGPYLAQKEKMEAASHKGIKIEDKTKKLSESSAEPQKAELAAAEVVNATETKAKTKTEANPKTEMALSETEIKEKSVNEPSLEKVETTPLIAKAAMGWSAPSEEEMAERSKESYFYYANDMTIGFGLPGFYELGTMIGFLSLFVFVTFAQMAKAPLLPINDPFLEETLHHVS